MAKKNLGVKIFGWLFIILNLAIISYVIFQGWKYRSIFKEMGVSGFWNFAYFFIIILTIILTIVGPIIYVIAGVGILKLRPWSRYLAIAFGILCILSLPNIGFIFGWQSYYLLDILVSFCFSALILWYFFRAKTKEQFIVERDRFRWRSWCGAAVITLLVLTAIPFLTVLGIKALLYAKYKQPFFSEPLKSIQLSAVSKSDFGTGFKERKINGLFFIIPEEFVFLRGGKDTAYYYLYGPRDDANFSGAIVIDSESPIALMRHSYGGYKKLSAYQFEKMYYSDKFAIIPLILSHLASAGKDSQVEMFNTATSKGIIKLSHREGSWICDGSLYDVNGNNVCALLFIMKDKYFSRDDIFKMIASIKTVKQSSPQEYYKKGLECFNKDNFKDADFEFSIHGFIRYRQCLVIIGYDSKSPSRISHFIKTGLFYHIPRKKHSGLDLIKL